MIKFNSIKQLTCSGNYEIDISLRFLKDHVKDHMTRCEDLAVLDINPDFQRAHVWNETQRTKYVEHLIRGGQSSKIIYLNCTGWLRHYEGPYVLVDGKQRLNACLDFLDNKVPVFGGHLYKDFDKIPYGIGIKWNVNNLKTRKEVLQWYLDLNEGGVIHTKEELQKVKVLLNKEIKNNS